MADTVAAPVTMAAHVSLREAARLLGVSASYLHKCCAKGRRPDLRRFKALSGRWRFYADAIEAVNIEHERRAFGKVIPMRRGS